MIPISSPQNGRVKLALKLRTRRGRVQQERFLVDGEREVARLIESPFALQELFVCSEWLDASTAQHFDNQARQRHVACYDLPANIFAKLTYGERADGVIGVALTTERSINELRLQSSPLLCVVEAIEKPGNLGAIMRSADGAGIDALIHAGGETDWFHPNSIRASTGALFSLPTAEASSEEALNWLIEHDIQIFAARPDATLEYYEADFRAPSALVLGNEARGLTDTWQSNHVTPIRIPMQGIADSLNVSVTSAILLFEAMRQRAVGNGNKS